MRVILVSLILGLFGCTSSKETVKEEVGNKFPVKAKNIIIPSFKQNVKGDITFLIEAICQEIGKQENVELKLVIHWPEGFSFAQKGFLREFEFDYIDKTWTEILDLICEEIGVIKQRKGDQVHFRFKLYTEVYEANSYFFNNLKYTLGSMLQENRSLDFQSCIANYIISAPGTYVHYLPSASKMIVTHYKSEHREIQRLIDQYDLTKQIRELEQKILESRLEISSLIRQIESLDKTTFTTFNRPLNIVIPKVNFINRDLEFFADFIKRKSRQLDEDGEGVNIIISVDEFIDDDLKEFKDPFDPPAKQPIKKDLRLINITADNISVEELIKLVCKQQGLQYHIEDYAVIIGENGHFTSMQTASFNVSRNLKSWAIYDGVLDLKRFLHSLGVKSEIGERYSYLESHNKLVITTTVEEIVKLQNIFKDLGKLR